MNDWHVVFDTRRCGGFGSCELILPEVFQLDDVTGKAVLLAEQVPLEQREVLERAARSCPTDAITVEKAC
jgi:ferredoxin